MAEIVYNYVRSVVEGIKLVEREKKIYAMLRVLNKEKMLLGDVLSLLCLPRGNITSLCYSRGPGIL